MVSKKNQAEETKPQEEETVVEEIQKQEEEAATEVTLDVQEEVSADISANEHNKEEEQDPGSKNDDEVSNEIVVAEGKSIVTLAGIKVAGDVVEARHFADGDETIADLVDKGFLVK